MKRQGREMPSSGTIEVHGLRAVYGTIAGAKPGDNQDAALLAAAPGGAVCAVADGVSSTPAAAAAAQAAVDAALSAYLAAPDDDIEGALVGAVGSAHDAVRTATVDESGAITGATTIVAAVFRGTQVLVANAGDSRAYLYTREGALEQITADHSWVEEQIQAGTLERRHAAAHPWRSVITRYLGGDAPPEVDTFDRVLEPGACLLLCTDGLMSALSEDEVTSALALRDPAAALDVLLRLAADRRAYDDVTVCIVQLDTLPQEGAER
jgi:protein phosphatase